MFLVTGGIEDLPQTNCAARVHTTGHKANTRDRVAGPSSIHSK